MKKFHLTQIGQPYLKDTKYGKQSWIKCQCDCGNICEKLYAAFKHDRCKTCTYKCLCRYKLEDRSTVVDPKDFLVNIGDKFTDWTVIDIPFLNPRIKYSKQKKRSEKIYEQYVLCQCICGKKKHICCSSLLNHHSKSCGCKTTSFTTKLINNYYVNDKKRCTVCKELKEISDFNKNQRSRDGLYHQCKFCKYISDFLSRNPKCISHITKLQLIEWLNSREKKCEICDRTENTHNIKLSIDHCHDTGKIRGLLCNNCNFALGHYQNSIQILEKAIKYLQKH